MLSSKGQHLGVAAGYSEVPPEGVALALSLTCRATCSSSSSSISWPHTCIHTHSHSLTLSHTIRHTHYIYIHTHSHHTRTRTTARVPSVTEEVLSGLRNTLGAAPRYSRPTPRQAEAPVALTCTVTAAGGSHPACRVNACLESHDHVNRTPPAPCVRAHRVGRTTAGDSAPFSRRSYHGNAHTRLGQEGSAPASLPAGSLKTGTRPGRLQEAGSALLGLRPSANVSPKGSPPHMHKSRSSCESLLWPYCFDNVLFSEEGNRSWEGPRLTRCLLYLD